MGIAVKAKGLTCILPYPLMNKRFIVEVLIEKKRDSMGFRRLIELIARNYALT